MVENIIPFPDSQKIEAEACAWVLKFEGTASPKVEDIEAFRAWMNQSAEHKRVLLHFAALWDDMGILSELMLAVPDGPKKSWLANFRAFGLTSIRKKIKKLMSNFTPVVAGLVVLTGVIALSVMLFVQQNSLQSSIGEPLSLATDVGQTLERRLPDGSTVWLNTNSLVQISLKPHIRSVTVLKGEAHFQVAKDRARPFEVLSGDRLVRAVGTAFSVRRFEHDVKVVVTEGKVELAAVKKVEPVLTKSANSTLNVDKSGVSEKPVLNTLGSLDRSPPVIEEKVLGFLSAGESTLLAEQDRQAQIKVEHHPENELNRNLAWRKGLLIFAGETLQTVVDEVGRYTTMKIDISDDVIADIRIGGQFHVGETDILFDVLERGFGLKVSRIDDTHAIIGRATTVD